MGTNHEHTQPFYKRKRIVIVDSNILWVQNLVETFAKSEHFYLSGIFYNGSAALEVIEDLRPDVIIIDLDLPGCSGLYLANYFYNSCGKYRPFIYFTFEETPENTALVYKKNSFVPNNRVFIKTKPVNVNTVLQHVLRFMTLESFSFRSNELRVLQRLDDHIQLFMHSLDHGLYFRRSQAAKMAFLYLLIENPKRLVMKELYTYVGYQFSGSQTANALLQSYTKVVKRNKSSYYQRHFPDSDNITPGIFYWEIYLLLKNSLSSDTRDYLPILKASRASDKLTQARLSIFSPPLLRAPAVHEEPFLAPATDDRKRLRSV